jgi:iron complex transport system ATP-binding protein
MNLLACRELTLRAGERTLVRALDLAIAESERWVVLGPNGAGKSTLLAALAGLRRPQAGRVEIAGRVVIDAEGASQWSIGALAERRALVTDRWRDPFASTVLETVLTARYRLGGRDLDGESVARACLDDMDCAALADRDVRQLSRGERQRVAVATALAQDTPLVLLDEPIAHQDPRHQTFVMQQLMRQHGRTFVATLHDMNAAAAFATHALLLTGRGPWHAGRAADVLTAEALGELFETEVRVVTVAGHGGFFAVG